jgi:hypothetical protein
MTFDDFNEHKAGFISTVDSLLLAKGSDYSGGLTGDRLKQFKEVAELAGTDPMVVWFVYFMKHVASVATFVKTGKNTSEPIYGRFTDIAGYAVIGAALAAEKEVNGEG